MLVGSRHTRKAIVFCIYTNMATIAPIFRIHSDSDFQSHSGSTFCETVLISSCILIYLESSAFTQWISPATSRLTRAASDLEFLLNMAMRLTFLFLITLACSVMVEDISAMSDTAQLMPSVSGATRHVWSLLRGAHFENVNFEVLEFDGSSRKMLHLREDMRTAPPTASTLSSSVTPRPRKLLVRTNNRSDPGRNPAPSRDSPAGPTG
ncbi:hypothetical protein MPTK1_8g10980 [Marchantia polymorpha subsp. ruderalis]|uniref:Uncharacterized protein n=1 Tax=Marchantia polymorpha TaxID=3197 RepID=A0A2R6XMW1_MARPO|nr:hypothetical protein MARPO_0008s0124 [Marchantia polymorpha]BBN19474.1 hypothetical protein Mp_8g10980 [Marchantia polymorpha subsp. ruderalis]|eukprot:PTQ47356.1 hypothetical protein MARPO_0008s0124 [Marchantia polymorpha]